MIKNNNKRIGRILFIAFCLIIFTSALVVSDEPGNKENKTEVECVTNAAGPLAEAPTAQQAPSAGMAYNCPRAIVGKPAPDFEATAYYKDGFTNEKLSDFAGKWVVLCFYPGDFTFV